VVHLAKLKQILSYRPSGASGDISLR